MCCLAYVLTSQSLGTPEGPRGVHVTKNISPLTIKRTEILCVTQERCLPDAKEDTDEK